MEEWRAIHGYTGRYEVSNLGRVRNCKTGKILAPRPVRTKKQLPYYGNQYWQVGLMKNGVRKNKKIHRLVCRAFHGPAPKGKCDVNHKDGDSENNKSENLEWLTHRQNMDHHKEDCICVYCSKLITEEEVWI